MQKLVFTNGNGKSIDLTGGNFGVTNWEGLSNTDLNIQTQQVPFNDGGVYLDALLDQREITVTVAIQDNNDLPTRYNLRRELISALNPKAGEGVLVYTNDYLSRQIKAVPQLPIFENKNANDSGSLKASVTFSCPSPYWEDTEETVVPLKAFTNTVVENNGDVPCGVKIEVDNWNTKNFSIKNDTQKIALDNLENCDKIKIDTNIGQKKIISEEMSWNLYLSGSANVYVIYETGKFVCVGAYGKILLSKDGKNWVSQVSNTSNSLQCVTYSQDLSLFVAVGASGVILTSPDGENWTSRTSGVSSILYKVIYSEEKGMFITVGASGVILTSTDGITWVSQTSGVSSNLNYICYSSTLGLFTTCGASGVILTSADGITWVSQTSGTSENLTCVLYSLKDNMFIICGDNSTLLTSTDGSTWVSQTGVSGLTEIIYMNDMSLYVGVGATKIYTSKNGITWEGNTVTSSTVRSIAYSVDLGLFVAVGYTGLILLSVDLIHWEDLMSNANILYYSGCYAEGLHLYIIVGANGLIRTSPDGIIWTTRSTPTSQYLYSVAYSKQLNLIVAVGYNNTILTSEDGITWIKNSIQTQTNRLLHVVYAEDLGVFVIAGENHSYTSTDGISWSQNSVGGLNSVCYSEELHLFVGVGNNGKIVTSENGISWTTRTSGINDLLWDVTYSEKAGLFLVITQISILIPDKIILTSADGITWTSQSITIPGTVLNACFTSAGVFIIAGYNGLIYISGDGFTWVLQKNIINVALWGGFYSSVTGETIIVGDHGTLLKLVPIEDINIIDHLSSDSDMTFNLKSGDNNLLLFNTPNTITGRVVYRPKYIGV